MYMDEKGNWIGKLTYTNGDTYKGEIVDRMK